MTEAWLLEIPEVPRPPTEYRRFVERRFLWQEMGATTHYADLTWAEAQEATAFVALEKKHPHRFKRAGP